MTNLLSQCRNTITVEIILVSVRSSFGSFGNQNVSVNSARTCLWEILYIPQSSAVSKERKYTGPIPKGKSGRKRHDWKRVWSVQWFRTEKKREDFESGQMSTCTYNKPSGQGRNRQNHLGDVSPTYSKECFFWTQPLQNPKYWSKSMSSCSESEVLWSQMCWINFILSVLCDCHTLISNVVLSLIL